MKKSKTKMKKDKQSKDKRRTSEKETVAHYNAVLIEGLKSDFRFVIEGLEGLRSELKQGMNEKFAEVDENFHTIRLVLQSHSRQFEKIDQRFEQIDHRFEKVNQRFDQIDQRFDQIDQRFEKVDQRFENMDQRFNTFEFKFDRVAEKVEGHDQAIQYLKTVVH